MKRLNIALLIGATMILNTAGALAAYPEHKQITVAFSNTKYPVQLLEGSDATAFKTRWLDTSRTQYDNFVVKETSDEDYVFVVGGRRFVLLDKDEDGNYFVGADEVYGKKAFNTWARGTDDDYMAAYTGNYTYDPERSTNIAYWLNRDFLTTGNGGLKIPQAIVDNLVEKEWVVEGGNKIVDNTLWKSDKIKSLVSSPTAQYPETGLESYTVTQKISLMSLTEYVAYDDIFSPRPYNVDIATNAWQDGWILRTPRNAEITIPTILSCMYLTGQKGGGSGTVSTLDNSTGHQVSVRPVFWLESDFFGEVAIDTDGTAIRAGAEVINTIKNKYAKAELSELYSKDILINGLGYAEFTPVAPTDLVIDGNMAVGETLTAEYTYKHEKEPEPIAEGDTLYQWYIQDSEGKFVKIDSATEKRYTVKPEDIGKQLKVSVKCVDENSSYAPIVMSGESSKVLEEQNVRAELIGFSGEAGVIAEFKVVSKEAGNAVILLGVYDENNSLVAMNVVPTPLSVGDNIVSVSLDDFDGKYARAFVISDLEKMQPYIMEEIIK